MACNTEPCGSAACDRCDPRQRYVLRQDSIRKVRYEIVVKADSYEEALAMLASGEAQGEVPTSYSEHTLHIISEESPVALTHEEAYPDRDHQRRFWRDECCLHPYRTTDGDNLADDASPDLMDAYHKAEENKSE